MLQLEEKPHDQLLSELRAELATSLATLQSAQAALALSQDKLKISEDKLTKLRVVNQDNLDIGQAERTGRAESERLGRINLASSQDKLKISEDKLTKLRVVNQDNVDIGQTERTGRVESERLGRIKDEFLANLSHEIRTPLNAILGWSQLLKPGKSSEADLVEGLEVITRNARTQARLIDDLLDMSRIISGKMRLEVQRVDLPAVIDAAIESVKPAAQAKGMILQKVVDPIAGPITGDPNRSAVQLG